MLRRNPLEKRGQPPWGARGLCAHLILHKRDEERNGETF